MADSTNSEHFTREGEGRTGTIETVEDARKAHHLATADPEPERGDGTLTGPAYEEKYGLERAERSAAAWRAAGVHPTENRALVGDEEGAGNLRGIPGNGAEFNTAIQTTADPRSGQSAPETAAAPRASDGSSGPRTGTV